MVRRQQDVDRVEGLFLQRHILYQIEGGMFDCVVDSRYIRLSVDYAQQRCLDVSDHYVFE